VYEVEVGVPATSNFTNLRPIAVICVLHGVSIGLAIDIATCADIRIAAQNAHMAVKEVDVGLAADIGSLARLPKVVGNSSWIKDVCFTARPFSPEEALAVGFVSRVLPDKKSAVEAALQLAGKIAGKSPVAVQGTKELLNHARDHSVDESKWFIFTYATTYEEFFRPELR
jgi:delta(3,5)-delta(2,4)-dienoyl-CoA isomerase